MTEYAVKIIPHLLSMRKKLFHTYWVSGKNYSTPTEYVAKIIPRLLSGRKKVFQKAAEWMIEQDGKFSKLFHAY